MYPDGVHRRRPVRVVCRTAPQHPGQHGAHAGAGDDPLPLLQVSRPDALFSTGGSAVVERPLIA